MEKENKELVAEMLETLKRIEQKVDSIVKSVSDIKVDVKEIRGNTDRLNAGRLI